MCSSKTFSLCWSALESLVEVERPALMLKWVGEGMEEVLDLLLDTGESDQ